MFEIITHLLIIVLLLILFILIWKSNSKEGLINNYLDGIDIIYWINLDRSSDRKEKMIKMFEDDAFSGISNERFSAVDGNNPDSIKKIEFIDPNERPGVYGCLLSHLETIRKFNNSNYDIALILEDDCTLEFKKYWKKSVRTVIQESPKDWEIIMLSYYFEGDDLNTHVLSNWDNMTNDYTSDQAYSTLAYIINKKGSNKLISSIYNKEFDIYNINHKLPAHADKYIYKSLKTYAYKYPFFIYNTDNDSTSTLGHNIDNHAKFKNKLIEQYNRTI